MQELLREIESVVGVRGAFLCSPEGEILASTLKGEAEPGTISAVAKTLNRTLEGLRLARRRKVQELDLVFDRGRLVVKNLPEGCLVIECTPNMNVPLLNMTVNLVVRKLPQYVKEAAAAPRPSAAPVPAAAGVGEAVVEKLRGIVRARMGEDGVEFFNHEMAAAGLGPTSSKEMFERLAAELDTPLSLAIGGRGARQVREDMLKVLRGIAG